MRRINKKTIILVLVVWAFIGVYVLLDKLPEEASSFYDAYIGPVVKYGLPGAAAAVALFLFIKAFIMYRDSKKINGVLSILWDECDPARFIEASLDYIDKSSRKKQLVILAKTNLAVGYFANGQTNKALEVLCAIDIDESKPANLGVNASVQYNLCFIRLSKKDIKGAMPHYEKLISYRQAAAKLSGGKRYLSVLNGNISRLDAAYAIAQDRHQDALSFYEAVFKLSKVKYEQVYTQFVLAEIYEKTEEPEKRVECLEYVAEHGNLLHMTGLARKALGTLGRNEPKAE